MSDSISNSDDGSDTALYVILAVGVLIPLTCLSICCKLQRRSQITVTAQRRRVIVRHIYHVDEQQPPIYQSQTSAIMSNPPPYSPNPA